MTKPKTERQSSIPVTAPQLAAMLRLSERHTLRLVAEGTLPAGNGSGRYDAAACVPAYIEKMRDSGDMESEKLAKLKAERQLKEIEVEKARADLVPVAEINDLLNGILSTVRSRLVFYLCNEAPQRNDGLSASAQAVNNEKLTGEVLDGMRDAITQYLRGLGDKTTDIENKSDKKLAS